MGTSLVSSALIEEFVLEGHPGHRFPCPECGPNRKKHGERTLAVHEKDGSIFYYCHHCGESGKVRADDSKFTPRSNEPEVVYVEVEKSEIVLSDRQVRYLVEERGISEDVIRDVGLVSADVFVSARGEKVPCIGFPYLNHDGSTATKWRDGLKNFTQTGVCSSLWMIERFAGGDLIICEGEMDALSLAQVGIPAVSVPNGAPSAPVKDDGVTGKKFAYLWNHKSVMDSADRILIASDADTPGDVLAEEIARRIGKARCWRVRYPEGCKDCNDVLVRHGEDALRKCVDEATPWPIGGLRSASEYKIDALDLFRSGMSRGVSVPVGGLDRIFRPCPGTLTICTGIPGSGKSTFLTWLSVKLAESYDWNVAVFSAETSSQIHLLNVASMHKRAPIRGPQRMSETELGDAIDWASDRFVFLDEAETSIESVIERGQAAVLRNGVRILMIDPYNWITAADDSFEAAHGNINKMLVKLKSFAVAHDIAVWLVAHPTKMYRGDSGKVPIPTGYDISGSAAFFNVADSGVTVSRMAPGVAKVTSWKARFPWLGSVGSVDLNFNMETGSFSTLDQYAGRDIDFSDV